MTVIDGYVWNYTTGIEESSYTFNGAEIMETNSLCLRLQRAAARLLCPECGSRMTEVDRLKEDGTVYVWYQCRNDTCKGQWLQKKSDYDFTLIWKIIVNNRLSLWLWFSLKYNLKICKV